MNKKIIPILFLSLLTSTSIAQESPPVQSQSAGGGGRITIGGYFVTCFLSIEAQALFDITPLIKTDLAYTNFYRTVSTQYNLSSEFLASSLSASLQDVANQQYTMAEKNYDRDYEIKEQIVDLENNLAIQNETLKTYFEDKAKFPQNPYEESQWTEIKKDTPEWDYYKAKCDQDKIATIGLGEKAYQKSSLETNKENVKQTRKQLSASNSKSLLAEAQTRMAGEYCDENNADAGLCETPSAAPNAHLMAHSFVSPSGDISKNEASPFKTLLTYSEFEEQISADFLLSIIMPFQVDPPTKDELKSSKDTDIQFVALYNTNLAAMNLAHQSMALARENRKPKNTVEIPGTNGLTMDLSHYDTLRFIIFQMNNDKALAAIRSANAKTAMEENYKASILRTKLQTELYMQTQRLNLLDAAILSMMNNSGDQMQYIKQIQ